MAPVKHRNPENVGSMTLIATISPHNQPLLISDVMVSAPRIADPFFELVLPTRAYISPNKRRSMSFTPVSFTRKICQINPSLVLMCAGDGDAAVQFAFELRDWFHNTEITEFSLHHFFSERSKHYAEKVSAMAFATNNEGHVSVSFGNRVSGVDEIYGQFIVAGSGTDYFRRTLLTARGFGKRNIPSDQDEESKVGFALIRALELASFF
jgi:hypothetical protein